jgi:hypothetical protein
VIINKYNVKLSVNILITYKVCFRKIMLPERKKVISLRGLIFQIIGITTTIL